MVPPLSLVFFQKLHTSGPVELDRPCCAPRHYAPLELIFLNVTGSAIGADVGLDYYNIEQVTIPDLIVAQCGCS